MRRIILLLTAVLLAAGVAAHAKTKLVASLVSPGYAGHRFHKVLVIGMSSNVGVRADFEDDMSAALARDGIEVVPGHTILLRPEGSKPDLDYLKTQVREHHIEAIVVSRLVKVDKTVTFVPGSSYMVPYPYYNSFYGYYPMAYTQVYTPDYLREDHKVRVETNLYSTSTAEAELVWTGLSDSFNPDSPAKVIEQVVKLTVKDLEKQGIF